ncbi:hypothetical protein AYW79_09580 [Ferroacidibacillus organovorans]|uniref:Transposase DDE domain-containing protein n=2 Tax=Ferroacidibacillus organovorans TaxID=1765683 RepID=A0A117SYN4_9BACL|nr:hypothetical protein ATW55_11785 [Ferroacidibacillus organovorans]KYP80220.1 hypothetical protein AYJ22_12165 [Ferroacidibacillus organovorans]OAG93602.1 hypothetical protein AYW79_09580 [Ferroacidibacillus organovorans]OPG17093.1 hypothetical protein B2M26_03230 [Ferroacidibacillus organovorans]
MDRRLDGLQRKSAKIQKRQAKLDAADRNAVEGKFGEGKRIYGLGLMKARLANTSATVITLQLLVMNLERKLRFLFCRQSCLLSLIIRKKTGLAILCRTTLPTVVGEYSSRALRFKYRLDASVNHIKRSLSTTRTKRCNHTPLRK